MDVESEVFGVAVGGLGALAASVAHATLTPAVTAGFGANASVTHQRRGERAARHNVGEIKGATAYAISGSGWRGLRIRRLCRRHGFRKRLCNIRRRLKVSAGAGIELSAKSTKSPPRRPKACRWAAWASASVARKAMPTDRCAVASMALLKMARPSSWKALA
ncbi:MAG: hypothetical protein MZV64_15795 [Ignavibacteriales bacterium]|nr:hypothetical protein [Ignavibacteriales bacterium]